VAIVVALAVACDTGEPSAPGAGSGTVLDPKGHLHFRGLVRDRTTKAPLPATLLSIEVGGLYRPFDDTSKASPFYAYGGLTAADGMFDVELPPGRVGVHAFTDGYVCGGRLIVDDLTHFVTIEETTLPASLNGSRPSVTSFSAVPGVVVAGAPITLQADVAAGAATPPDPLSDEVLVIEPSTFWSGELDPPSKGDPSRGYPDGRYSRQIASPTAPGAYTYHLVTMSQGCVPSDPRTATVTVTAAD
jgi:hypothetical protein